MSLKSIHLTNYYHKNSGGISTAYNNLLDAARRHQRYVRLIVPGETEEVEDVNEFAKIYYIPARQSPVFDQNYRIIMPWQYLPNSSLTRKIILKEMPDMIEVTDKYSLSIIGAMIRKNKFKQIGRPMLVHFSCERMDDNINSYLTKSQIGKLMARCLMRNYILPSFDFHVANSDYTAQEFYEVIERSDKFSHSDWFLKKCWQFFKSPRITFKERVYVCPCGVDINAFRPERQSESIKLEMRKRANIPKDSIVLLYAGRISPEKNIGLLLDFMKVLVKDTTKDFRLLIAGKGPQSDWLKEETKRHIPNKIIQLGYLDKEKLADYYANADIFVHPNPREPFGIAPLEAMASGVPVVAPNAGGILSYATNENIWLTEPTAEKFALAIKEIVENNELRNDKTSKAIITARKNTQESSTDNIFATYDKMFEDFTKRNELFTDRDKIKDFDFVKFLNSV